MNKASSDSKVKKTLVRNYEVKGKPSMRKQIKVVHDVASSSNLNSQKSSRATQKEHELSEPTLCSSRVLANYLCDIKKSSPPPPSTEDLNIDRGELSSKITKKLNFHFNDKIYRNLIELNSNVENLKTKKGRRPSSITSLKKDLEPNMEDFYEDEQETDSPPNIPVLKPKYRPIKKVEDGHLHKLVAAFDYL